MLSADPATQTVVISHRPIAGYMPAMTMPFHVRSAEELKGLAPGSRVRFELHVTKHESMARNLKLVAGGLEGLTTDTGEPIRVTVPAEKVAIGSAMPDFALVDQQDRPVRLSDYRGRVVAIDFIYTRCPLPDVCPRLSANFALLQKRLRDRLRKDLALVSITIDPQYDTPEVLAGYARRWQADNEHWRFLTGPPDQIQKVAAFFGLIYWPEEGSITHTSVTAVIGRDGKLAALVEGSKYRADQLVDLVAHFLDDRP